MQARRLGGYAVWAGLNIGNIIAIGVRTAYVLLVIIVAVKSSIDSGALAFPIALFGGWLFYPIIQRLFPLDRWEA